MSDLIHGLVIATNLLTGFTLTAIDTNWHTDAIIKPQPERTDGRDWVFHDVGVLVTNRVDIFVVTNAHGMAMTNIWSDETQASTNLFERFRTNMVQQPVQQSAIGRLLELPYGRRQVQQPPPLPESK